MSLIKQLINKISETEKVELNEFNVQSALKASDKSDAGTYDVTDKATSSNDVEFNLMRNVINSDGEVTGSDVANYIERAEELNDEVDTVPFGLETDDGKIVKVYVNAEEADKFEIAMKNMLGLEDDIEEAINRLATEFDIIDVVWPKSFNGDEDEESEDDDLSIEDSSFDEDDDDDFADDQFDVIADRNSSSSEEDNTSSEDDLEDQEDTSSEDEEESDDDESSSDKPKKKKKSQPPEPVPTEEGQQNNITQENRMTIGSKFLNRVINEAAGAEDRDGVKDGFNIPLDSQARAMAAKLKLPMAKKLVAFHFMCGVPGRYMNTPEVTEGISSAADMLRKKVAVRRAFTSLYDGLASAKGFNIPSDDAVAEGKDENGNSTYQTFAAWKRAAKKLNSDVWFDGDKDIAQAMVGANPYKRGSTKSMGEWDGASGWLEPAKKVNEAKAKRGSFIQKLLESVLVELGLPQSLVVTTGPAVVGTGIYNSAELIEQDSTLERALRLLATRMGISGQDAMQPVQEVRGMSKSAQLADTEESDREYIAQKQLKDKVKKHNNGEIKLKTAPKGYKFDGEKIVKESLDEAVDVGNDDFAQAIVSLVSALGIPDDLLERRRSQVVQALRQKKASLRNRAQVLTMIGRLQDLLQKNTVQDSSEIANEAKSPVAKFKKGDSVEWSMMMDGEWSKVKLTSDLEKDENGKWGYKVGKNKFAFAKALRPVKLKESALKNLVSLTEAPAKEGTPEQIAKKIYSKIKSESNLNQSKVKTLVKKEKELIGNLDSEMIAYLVIDMLEEKGLM